MIYEPAADSQCHSGSMDHFTNWWDLEFPDKKVKVTLCWPLTIPESVRSEAL